MELLPHAKCRKYIIGLFFLRQSLAGSESRIIRAEKHIASARCRIGVRAWSFAIVMAT